MEVSLMPVLYVNSSPRGKRSESARLAEAVLAAAREASAGLAVDRLDLFSNPLPSFAADAAAAKMAVIAGDDPTDATAAAWDAITETVGRVRRADTLLFTVPMWNGSIPWALKLFIDTVTQPGMAFRFDPQEGYSGLLDGRRAIAIYTSQVYAPGRHDARFGTDHQSTYFENWLRFTGIERIDAIRLQPTFPGRPDLDEARTIALDHARRIGADLGRSDTAA